jgi:hypothetical protein
MPVVVGLIQQTPTEATSTDGIITARLRAQHAGVLLTAQTGARPTVASVTFLRIDPDGSEHIVRGGDYTSVNTGFAVAYDAEAPLGVPVDYRVELYAAGADEPEYRSQPATAMLPTLAQTAMLAVDRPSAHVPFYTSTYDSLSRSRDATVLRVIGRADPVVLSGTRSLRQFGFTALVANDALDTFDALLEADGPMLLRPQPQVGLPAMYVQVTDDAREGYVQGAGRMYKQWSTSLVEVARPNTSGSAVRIPGQSFRESSGTIGTDTGTFRSGLLS